MWRVRGHENTTHATSTWVFVWDLAAPDRPVAASGSKLRRRRPALTPTATLFTADPLTRHDVTTGRSVQLPEPWENEDAVEIVEMSPDGRSWGCRAADGVAVLDPRTGAVRRQMQVEPDD